MKYLATLSAACAIGLSAMASQAEAKLYSFTQTGTVSSGIDVKGLFGDANANLAGQQFSVVFTWDTDLAHVENTHIPGYLLRQRGTTASVEMVIAGVNYAIDVDHFGFNRMYLFDGNTYNYTGFSVVGSSGGMDFEVASKENFLGSVALTAPQHYTLTDADRAIVPLTHSYWDGDGFKFVFRPETISLTEFSLPVSAVPEPTSWALMLTGFGLLGGALRARRKTVGQFG